MITNFPILSVCIPTYNRSAYLAECLESVLLSAKGYEQQIEIVISDNASTDDTLTVVNEFRKRSPCIRYYRNGTNLGSEQNRYIVVGLASGEYIWILADDDKVMGQAVSIILERIKSAYNLIVCNFSVWSRDFSVRKMRRMLPTRRDREFSDRNALMKCFGLHVGFTPSFIIKRDDFLSVPPAEYGPFMQYGFPHVYSVYAATARNCRATYISAPLICHRADNSFVPDYYRFFVAGSALVFEALRSRGFTEGAVRSAKRQVLKHFVIGNIVLRKSQADANLKGVAGLLLPHYRKDWLFWTVCVPLLYVPIPTFLAQMVVKVVRALRKVKNR